MPRLEWREDARADLLAIIDFISDDNADAAQRLKDDIEAKTSKLPGHPRLYRPGRVDGTREMVVRSNYLVVYAENAHAISILRDLHAAQHGRQCRRPRRSDCRSPRSTRTRGTARCPSSTRCNSTEARAETSGRAATGRLEQGPPSRAPAVTRAGAESATAFLDIARTGPRHRTASANRRRAYRRARTQQARSPSGRRSRTAIRGPLPDERRPRSKPGP